MPKTDTVVRVLDTLQKEYPDARVTLNFRNPLQLLIATILAAQCTDERVNRVTKDLFRKYRTAAEFGHPEVEAQAKAPLKDAAAVNATRYKLVEALSVFGLPLGTWSGGRRMCGLETLCSSGRTGRNGSAWRRSDSGGTHHTRDEAHAIGSSSAG